MKNQESSPLHRHTFLGAAEREANATPQMGVLPLSAAGEAPCPECGGTDEDDEEEEKGYTPETREEMLEACRQYSKLLADQAEQDAQKPEPPFDPNDVGITTLMWEDYQSGELTLEGMIMMALSTVQDELAANAMMNFTLAARLTQGRMNQPIVEKVISGASSSGGFSMLTVAELMVKHIPGVTLELINRICTGLAQEAGLARSTREETDNQHRRVLDRMNDPGFGETCNCLACTVKRTRAKKAQDGGKDAPDPE